MLKSLVFIFLGGGLGAALRFLIGKFSLHFFESNFPLGTLLSNLIACVLLGVLVYQFNLKLDIGEKALYLFLVVGFCGGLSTFSTFSIEMFELLKQGHFTFALLNLLISVGAGIGAIYFLYKQQ